jgi:2,3-bisphosphoglycerate-dependent phosphoglycerate mutase
MAPKGRKQTKKVYNYSELTQGTKVQVESEGIWYAAEVVAVSTSKNRTQAPVKVSYKGYDGYDEWVNGDRLRSKALIVDVPGKTKEDPSGDQTCHARLVFSRHGESEWNVANKFTGWVDVDLSDKGVGEAKNAGDLIKAEGLKFDVCYTSFLKRAIKTCNLALENADQLHVPVNKTWRLNERMYGGLTGLDKKETVVKHGAEQVLQWRRSFDLPPPDIAEDSEFHPKLEAKYAGLKPQDIPKSESLKTVISRVMPYWKKEIQSQLRRGKTVFVAAHGNSIRAIVKFIEGIADDEIPGLEIPTGTPLVYELDRNLKPIPNDLAVAPLKYGRYLGDAEKIKAAAEAVKNQTKV